MNLWTALCAPFNADFDFLTITDTARDIVTNPPFNLADKFISHALKLTEPNGGKVAMLLPCTFDTAKSRRYLFWGPPFKIKYTITKRIRWENLVQKKRRLSEWRRRTSTKF